MSDDKTIKALAASLDMRQIRQELAAANVANAETPGYKAKEINFEEALARALDVDGAAQMKTTDGKHYQIGSDGFDGIAPEITESNDGVVSPDGNTVDRDKEMAIMAENKILYDASVQLLNKKLALLKYVVGTEH